MKKDHLSYFECLCAHARTRAARASARAGGGVRAQASIRIRYGHTAQLQRSALNDNVADIDTWGRAVRCSDCRVDCWMRQLLYNYSGKIIDSVFY